MAVGKKGKSSKQSKKPKAQAKKNNKGSVSPVVKATLSIVTTERTDAQISADLEEIRAEVRADPDYRRKQKAEWRRWRRLADDKDFVEETFQLIEQLKPFVDNDPARLKQFFRPAFFVAAPGFRTVESKIDSVDNEQLRTLLKRYARYVLRYQIVLTLVEKPRYFRTQGLGFLGNKSHVAIREGQLEPIGGLGPWLEGVPAPDAFGSDEVPVPAGLQPLIDSGRAKYMRIDDKEEFSLLRQITDAAYSPDQVTVIDYNSSLRTKLYMIGDNVPLNSVWSDLGTVVSQSQRETGGNERRGAPADLRQLYAKLNTIVRGKGSMIAKAAKFVRGEQTSARVAVIQARLSQLKRKLQE